MENKKNEYSKEEYINYKENEIKKLQEEIKNGIKDALNSEKYIDFLETISKFHKYSINNAMLILLQKPNATYVAGFSQWEKQGVKVNKGEKHIKIFAPILKNIDIYEKDNKGDYVLDKDSNKIKVGEKKNIYFKVTKVFDISQTNAKDNEKYNLIKSNNKIINNKDEILNKLQKVSDINFEFSDNLGDASGVYNKADNTIKLKNGLNDIETISVAVHEVAHSMLHNDLETSKLNKKQKEFEAESVAYIVNRKLGIDSKENNFLYLANWVGKDDISEFEDSMIRIHTTSGMIINEFIKENSMGKFEEMEM